MDDVLERRVDAPMEVRAVITRPDSFDATNRTIEVVWTTGARGARFNWNRWEYVDEELGTDASNVRLDRLNGGAPVLNTHGQYELDDQIGVVVPGTARMEGGEGIATLQLSARADVASIVEDIAAGIIRNLSVGYRVHEYEITEREGERALYRATDWEPYEISFVPVPFDAGSQVRSEQTAQGGHPCIIRRQRSANLETSMNTATTQAGEGAAVETREQGAAVVPPIAPATEQRAGNDAVERFTASSAVAFVELARSFGDAAVTRANELVAANERGEVSPGAASHEILNLAADRNRAATAGIGTGGRPITMPEEQFANRAAAMTGAILHMTNPGRYQIDDNSRAFAGQSLRTLARSFMEGSGVRTAGMSDVQIAQQVFQRSAGMHSTSDFPAILGGVVRRTLRDAYALAPRTYQAWARRVSAPDFREIRRVALSDAPALEKVEEHGEYTYGTMGDSAEKFQVAKYGKIITVTWETIVNDDLDALSRIPAAFGQSSAQKESDIVYGLLLDNNNMADGYALFSTQHGNLAATGAAISITTLAAARAAMRKQKSPGGSFMAVEPGILLVGPDSELVAYQFTSANYVPVTNGTINPDFNRNLKVVVDGRITGNAWFLLVDPTANPTDSFEYAYLAGEEGVMISERQGFEIDGMEIRARLVFGAGAIEYRGAYKNPGA